MTHYLAIVDHEPGKAVGVWFPDLKGCFSAGDTLEEALLNAQEALLLYAESLADDGEVMPPPRTPDELTQDPEASEDMARYMVALIPFHSEQLSKAAE
jgi:predicted RNase H-like HicB family nuclease